MTHPLEIGCHNQASLYCGHTCDTEAQSYRSQAVARCRTHLRARLVLWNKFTHFSTETLAPIHAQTAEGTRQGQKYSQTSLPLSPLFHFAPEPAGGVGPAADNKPTVVEYSLCQPMRTAWVWTAANDNMFSTAEGRVLSLTQEKKSGSNMQQRQASLAL